MVNPLATYLVDHLAGSAHATELVKNMHKEYSRNPLGQFAADLLVEVEADQKVLQELADCIGAGSSGLKELTV